MSDSITCMRRMIQVWIASRNRSVPATWRNCKGTGRNEP